MHIPLINLKAQYLSIKEEIDSAIKNAIENSSFILGKDVEAFEKEFASFCNKNYAVAVNSGTSALHLALTVNGIKKSDEVITVPNTFFATAEAISYTGAKPVFVDIDNSTYNIDPNKIEENITKKTKAIIPVHLYGHPVDMDSIEEIAKKYNLTIIEDCCHSHGAEYKKNKVPIEDFGCFSFYPSKNIGAFGEGGIIVTNNKNAAEELKLLRAHYEHEKNVHKDIGYNYRMEGLQGAVLRVKLKYLDSWNKKRRNNAKLYNEVIIDDNITKPVEMPYAKHVYYLYTIRSKERDKLRTYLSKNNIDTGIYYPIPIPFQRAYSNLKYKEGSFPISEQLQKQVLSLPIFPELKEEEIIYVAEKINEFFRK